LSVKHPVERGGEGRGHFDRAAERVSNVASSPAFFWACSAVIAAWLVSYAADWSDVTRGFLGDLLAAVTLALVAMLKNAERRAEHAVQYKLDAILGALLARSDELPPETVEELERAVGRDEAV
jgi:low affinity Fe/Cu permease